MALNEEEQKILKEIDRKIRELEEDRNACRTGLGIYSCQKQIDRLKLRRERLVTNGRTTG